MVFFISCCAFSLFPGDDSKIRIITNQFVIVFLPFLLYQYHMTFKSSLRWCFNLQNVSTSLSHKGVHMQSMCHVQMHRTYYESYYNMTKLRINELLLYKHSAIVYVNDTSKFKAVLNFCLGLPYKHQQVKV